MSDKVLPSRRAFATGAGLIATAAFSSARAAPGKSRQDELVTLSNRLYSSPEQRQAFIADPQGFVSKLGLHNITPTEISNLRAVFADGFCCNGCGCGRAS
jgi:hypothetical protein